MVICLVASRHKVGAWQDAGGVFVKEGNVDITPLVILVVKHVPGDIQHQVGVLVEQPLEDGDMLHRVHLAQFLGEPHVRPHDLVIRVGGEDMFHQGQVFGGVGVVTEVGVEGNGNAAFLQHRHEWRPLIDALHGGRFVIVFQ